jgi:tricorn protease
MSKLLAAALFALSIVSVSAQNYLTEPSLSPDRKEIVFVSGGDIWSVPAEGGTASLLVSHPANESRPMFSPDGRYLAFNSNRTGNGDLYILELASGNLRRLTFDDVNELLDAWSRDGRWIYFSSGSRDISGFSDVYRVAATGGTPMQVSADRYAGESQASPLADGAFVFAARASGLGQWWRRGSSHLDETELWIKSGETYTQLTPRAAKQQWPMATADGSRIYFMSDRSGAQNLWMMPRGGQAKQMTNFTDGRVLWPSLSYDGEEIVFERNFRIWKTKAGSGAAKEIPVTLRGASSSPLVERVNIGTQIREMALSPDGKKVAIISRGEVFAASAKDGGDAVRVTTTAAPESFPAWTTDSRKLIYASDRDGSTSFFQYDFATDTETQLTRGFRDGSPVFSPDGKKLAFIRDGRKLMVLDIETKAEREVAPIYSPLPPLLGRDEVKFSPDGKWLAFLTNSPETRSYTNVSVVPVEGGQPRPVSFLANSFAGSLAWSPDGSYILFDTAQRTEEGLIARIDLKLRTPRFREDQFRDLFKQENPRDKPVQPTTTPSPTPAPATSPSPASTPEKKDEKATEIVFEDIRRRLSLLNTGVDSSSAIISPDGKTLLVLASAEGQFNIYTMPLDELATDQSARQLTSTPGFKSSVQFSPDGKEVYFLENGRIQIVTLDRREVRPLNVNVEMTVKFADEKMEVFKQVWRYMRDHFYDDKFHGVNWDAARATYEPLVANAKTMDEARRLMAMMVGELNASHLGVGGPAAVQGTPVGKLGLRFDRNEYEANGNLRITEIINLGPVAVQRSAKVGDYLLSVDGRQIAAGVNIDEVLEGKTNRRVVLVVASSPSGTDRREIVVKPVTTNDERNLLYIQWVEANRAYVSRISNGRIGYVHLPDMSQASLNQLYIDLDAENQAKEGVVVDIRNNNGGFINPYVVDILSRRGYLTMRERGFWNVPARSALGQRSLERPTVLVINQQSLSDAEDLTEGYKTLKLGKVVGEKTSGWIIYTWNTTLYEGTTLRLPRQLILGADGKNMELNPRTPDIEVVRPVGETLTGKDSQLDRAVRELIGGN